MDINFSSVAELRKRLTPALRLRIKLLKRDNINMTEDMLWDYLVNKYWKKANNLLLYEMVNDILNKEVGGDKDE